MLVVYYLFLGLLATKVVWNIIVPYVSLRRASSAAAQGETSSGISLMVFVEWALILLVSVTASLLTETSSLAFGTFTTFLGGSAAAIASYVHAVVVSAVVGRKTGDPPPARKS